MADDDPLTFPDAPRSALDKALTDLVDRANDVLETHDRLRALLRANALIVEHIDLEVVLRRIAEAAVSLLGARYGALGVIAPQGGLEQFIHVGMPPDVAETIGHLPQGKGLLGALIDDPHPIRLDHLTESVLSAGFPHGHPAMESFLGVPIRVRDEVFGNLYLTDSRAGRFSREDEELALALAATAGIAIENARLFAETEHRQAWMAASADLTALVLSVEGDGALAGMADRLRDVADADLVSLVLPASADGTHPAGLVIAVARGHEAERLEGTRLDATSLAASVLESGQPALIDAAVGTETADETLWTGAEAGSVMAIPLRAEDRRLGVLFIVRAPDRPAYRPADVDLAADLAGQVSVAMELATARSDQQRMLVLEDRGRIARDLHDHVIQDLFATGLDLQSLAPTLSAAATSRVLDAVDRLDASISQIRTVIFALDAHRRPRAPNLRQRLLDLAAPAASGVRNPPSVAFSGPIDLLVTGDLADDAAAVVHEALSNIAQHADAESVRIAVSVDDGRLRIEVGDDGRGIAEQQERRGGLANMAARAERRGGLFSIGPERGGTVLRWESPLVPALERIPA